MHAAIIKADSVESAFLGVSHDLASTSLPPIGPTIRSDTQQPVQINDFEAMKAIIEPFNHIFNTITERIKSQAINRVEFESNREGTNGKVPIYTVYSRQDDGLSPVLSRGTGASPHGASPSLQRALQKLNLCDTATYSILPYITQAVQKIRSRADALLIHSIVPRLLLTYPDQGPSVCDHSICIITSASGEQYIADFTLEQFGFDSDMWFMKRRDYHDLVCNGHGGVCSDDEWYEDIGRLTSDVREQSFLYRIGEATRKACGAVGTMSFEKLQGSEQVDWLRDRAIEAVLSYE